MRNGIMKYFAFMYNNLLPLNTEVYDTFDMLIVYINSNEH